MDRASNRSQMASSHHQSKTISAMTDTSFGLRPPNPLPPSNFPAVAFSPVPRRPQRNAFKRLLSRGIRKLKKYLDKKAAKYQTESKQTRSTKTTRKARQTSKTSPQYSNRKLPTRKTVNGNRHAGTPQVQSIRSSSGTQPLRRHNASTTSLDSKGPFSASQKQDLSRKLTTIRESSVDTREGASSPSLVGHASMTSYNDLDAASDPTHNAPTTPIPEQAESREYFPNLTSRRCQVDWARMDELALDDYVLLQNTEAMRDVSRDAAAMLRATEMGLIRPQHSFDDSAWREVSMRHSISTLINVKRWRRHGRTTSGQSIPSLSYSQSTPGSVSESFPTPANAILSLEQNNHAGHGESSSIKKKDPATNTPVITVSVWDEETSSLSSPGISRTLMEDELPETPNYLRPSTPKARLRGKKPWYLQEWTPPLASIASLSVPSETVAFPMERPLEVSNPYQPLIYA